MRHLAEVRRLTKLDQALALAADGFKVFPIKAGAKTPPLLNGWPDKATTDQETVRLFWLAVPDANIGIHCEGLFVLDVDVKKGGKDALAKLGPLPDTLRTITPSGGEHLFFRLPAGHAGVSNTVGVLGPGLDVRSTGGYVVAPGSVVAAGTYRAERAPIADAPVSLLDRCGPADPRSRGSAPAVADAPDDTYEQARQWLAGQLPAFEGHGGDARTFAVAAGLRDRGVSKAQALTLLEGWNATCAPPWAPEDLAVKVANAYRYAENDPGAKVALPSDFPVVPELGTVIPNSGTISGTMERAVSRVTPKILGLREFASLTARSAGYVVKGMFQRQSYACMYGAPGEGKTFVALDLAYHVAAGAAWMGAKVHAGPVLYLAYEGTGGMVKRAQALRQRYGDADVPLYIVNSAFNLREKTGRAELGDIMALLPNKATLIVIDTFARALMGGDENSAQDVGAFNSAVAALIASTGACVLVIHHSGKDKTRGARGSSALLGALDTEVEIDGHQILARKQRDVEIAAPIGFKLVPVVVGIDDDNDDVSSCIVEPMAAPQGRLARLAGNYLNGFEALCKMSPDNSPVQLAQWRDACREFLGDKRLSGTFYNIKSKLLKTGHIIERDDGKIERRLV